MKHVFLIAVFVFAAFTCFSQVLPLPVDIWQERTYQQKVDFIRNTLYQIKTARQLPEYISITDKKLSTHRISPELMVIRIDCFYIMYPKSNRVPCWLAMLYQEQKIDSWVIENIMEKLWNKEQTLIWMEE